MADTVDILGKSVPKKTAYIVGGGAALVVAYALYKRHQNAANATAAANTSATGGTADNPGNIDPATGYVSGSAEDVAALAAQGGGYGLGYGIGGGIAGGGNVNTNVSPNPAGGYTSNSQWAQAAEAYITGGSGGGGPTDAVGNALGKYLTGGELTPDQQSIVNQAIAFQGYPPVSGPNGYPPAMRTAPTPTPAAQTQVRVPSVIGARQEDAFTIISEAGLKPIGTPVVHGKVLHVVSQKPTAGATVNKGTTVTLTSKV